MKRRILIMLAIVAAVFLAGGIWLIATVRYGLSAHDRPTAAEVFLARTFRRWAVPADLRDAKNPVPLTPEVLAEARSHFADHCATCHGIDGKGSDMGRRMHPQAPDMTLPATQSLSDGELFATIENGVRMTGMPGWGTGTAESAYGSWTLVHFIRQLPKATSPTTAAAEAPPAP